VKIRGPHPVKKEGRQARQYLQSLGLVEKKRVKPPVEKTPEPPLVLISERCRSTRPGKQS